MDGIPGAARRLQRERAAVNSAKSLSRSTSSLPSPAPTTTTTAASSSGATIASTRSSPFTPGVQAKRAHPAPRYSRPSSPNVCKNPASPSYGARVCNSLPDTMTTTTSSRSSVSVEELSELDSMAISTTPMDAATEFVLDKPSAGPTLSQIPYMPLVPYEKLIPTGVVGFFHTESAQRAEPRYVMDESRRLIQQYRSVNLLPFAAVSIESGMLQKIAHHMSQNWRSPDAHTCYGLTKLKEWFSVNVSGPMYAAEMIDVHFETKLCVRSLPGSGVRMFLIEACRQAGINLIVVNNTHRFPDEFGDLVRTSHLCKPCLVLFDHCDNWFMNEYPQTGMEYIALLSSYHQASLNMSHAAHGSNGGVAVRPDQVWTVYSLGTHGNVHEHFYPEVANATVVPVAPAAQERREFVRKLLATLCTPRSTSSSGHAPDVLTELHQMAPQLSELADSYCKAMPSASLGEMHTLILNMQARKRRLAAVTMAASDLLLMPRGHVQFLPTQPELMAEIKKRHDNANQNVAEVRRLNNVPA